MANHTFELKHGLDTGNSLNTKVEMRPITAGDIIAAEEESEICYVTTQGPVVMSSPTRSMVILLCRVTKRIGEISPVTAVELKKLHAEDFDMMQDQYLKLRGQNNLAELGRDSESLQPNA